MSNEVPTPAEYQDRANAALAEAGIDAEVLSTKVSDSDPEVYEVEWRWPRPILQITIAPPRDGTFWLGVDGARQ